MADIVYTQVWSPMLNAVDPNIIQATDRDYPDVVVFIPNDDGNKDWLDEGNQPNPPPGTVTPHG